MNSSLSRRDDAQAVILTIRDGSSFQEEGYSLVVKTGEK